MHGPGLLERSSTSLNPSGGELRIESCNQNFAATAELVKVGGIRIERSSEVESGIQAALTQAHLWR
ncbi:protein of unknown function [Pararobbsia alpina]